MKRIAALVLVGFGALAAPALAAPGDDAKISTDEVTLTFNSNGSATAFCDGGATALGGGVASEDPLGINLDVNVSAALDRSEIPAQTRTGDRPREWYASIYDGEGSDQTIKVAAICSKSAQAKLRVKTFKVAPSKTQGTVVSCPDGQRALGGGLDVATVPQDALYEEASGPLGKQGGPGSVKTGDSPRRWMVAAYNGLSLKRTFRAMVICSAQINPKITVASSSVAPPMANSDTAACPGGTLAFGGGVLPTNGPRTDLQLFDNTPLGPGGTVAGTTDGDAPRFWEAGFLNRGGKSRAFKVLAVCG